MVENVFFGSPEVAREMLHSQSRRILSQIRKRTTMRKSRWSLNQGQKREAIKLRYFLNRNQQQTSGRLMKPKGWYEPEGWDPCWRERPWKKGIFKAIKERANSNAGEKWQWGQTGKNEFCDKFCDNHLPLVRWLSWSKGTDRGPILSAMPQYGDLLHSQMHGTILANVMMS